MKKKNIALLIVTLVAVASIAGYMSYSIISMGITDDEYNVLATASNGLVFTAEGGNNFTNKVLDNSMAKPEDNTAVSTTSDTVNITLTTDGKKGICCSYDIEWVWDSDTKDQYKKSDSATNEFVVEGSSSITYSDSEGTNVALDNNEKFTSQIPDYDASEKTLKNVTICNTQDDTENISKTVVQSYTLETKFYNLKEINQDKLKGKTFKGHIEIANIKCTKKTS